MMSVSRSVLSASCGSAADPRMRRRCCASICPVMEPPQIASFPLRFLDKRCQAGDELIGHDGLGYGRVRGLECVVDRLIDADELMAALASAVSTSR
jgi:hypothetical protein